MIPDATERIALAGLEAAVAKRCMCADCRANGAMFLAPNCHNEGVYIRFNDVHGDWRAIAYCATCHAPVITVGLSTAERAKRDQMRWRANSGHICFGHRGRKIRLDMAYAPGSGELSLSCHHCNQHFWSMEVAIL